MVITIDKMALRGLLVWVVLYIAWQLGDLPTGGAWYARETGWEYTVAQLACLVSRLWAW